MRRRFSRFWLLSVSTALSFPALAEEGDTSPSVVTHASRATAYDAAFFARYAPRNALDIARQVPAFALDLGNSDTRGFAGAAGNVVINGARTSSKTETLETILSRIPARSVIRVEVGTGDLYGSEYSGKSQVLNVILSAESGIDGNVIASARRLYNGKLVPNLSASALVKRGASSINMAAGTQRNDQVEEGTDTLADPQTGDLIEHRIKVNKYNERAPYVSGSWALEQASNKALRVNARYSHDTFYLTQANYVAPAGATARDDDLVPDYKNPVFELGGDITRPLAGGAIKLVGLATRRTRDNQELYRFRANDVTLGGFEQFQQAQRNETLARLTWNRSDLAGFSFETGVEAVYNTLDARNELFLVGAGDMRTRIDLPIDEATVEEKRAETFVNVGRQLSPAFRVDGGLTFEYSDLAVRGDTRADRTLKFLKPNLTLDWKPGGGWHTQISVRRKVAQLDFYDFISSAELSNDRVNAGNAELLPQRTWEIRATIDRPILGDGLVKLDLGHDRISLLQDRVLTEDGFDAPGNIGTGKRSFARLTVDAPLARLGLTGTRLKLNGQLQQTRVEDPITGKMRDFSGFYSNFEWQAELRRDAGAFSYGVTVLDRSSFTFFRTDEIDRWNPDPYATAFVEYRPSGRTTVTFDVNNLFNTGGGRDRLISIPNRLSPEPAIRELRERNQHVSFGLTLKQSFGGGGNGSGVAQAS